MRFAHIDTDFDVTYVLGGHNNDKDRWFTIERVYCIKHVRLVGVLLSECLADRCLLNI